jgi:hypothetical protein
MKTKITTPQYSLIGKSMCHPNDTFDINIGIERACADAVREYLIFLKEESETHVCESLKIYNEVCNTLEDVVNYYKLNRASKTEEGFKVKRKEFF